MNNEQHHPEHAQEAFLDALFAVSPTNLAALLRASADAELSPSQHERLQQLVGENASTQSRVAFEKALRGRCGQIMAQPSCPSALRERIVALAASAAGNDYEPENQENHHMQATEAMQDEGYANRIEDLSRSTRDRSFWTHSPVMGVAAMLLLSLAGVLIWQSTNLPKGFTPGSTLNIEQASYTQRMSQFALSEHIRCCQNEAAEAKLIQRDVTQAIEYFTDRFDRPVQMPQMAQHSGQIEFFGGGDCNLPETKRSGHLRFDAFDEQGKAISLSLFIAPDPAILPLKEGVTYRVSSAACDAADARMFVWVNDGVQYLLVSEASDKTCAMVRDLMNAPANLKQL